MFGVARKVSDSRRGRREPLWVGLAPLQPSRPIVATDALDGVQHQRAQRLTFAPALRRCLALGQMSRAARKVSDSRRGRREPLWVGLVPWQPGRPNVATVALDGARKPTRAAPHFLPSAPPVLGPEPDVWRCAQVSGSRRGRREPLCQRPLPRQRSRPNVATVALDGARKPTRAAPDFRSSAPPMPRAAAVTRGGKMALGQVSGAALMVSGSRRGRREPLCQRPLPWQPGTSFPGPTPARTLLVREGQSLWLRP